MGGRGGSDASPTSLAIKHSPSYCMLFFFFSECCGIKSVVSVARLCDSVGEGEFLGGGGALWPHCHEHASPCLQAHVTVSLHTVLRAVVWCLRSFASNYWYSCTDFHMGRASQGAQW